MTSMDGVRTFRDLSPIEQQLFREREPLIRSHLGQRTVILCRAAGDAVGAGTLVDFNGTPMIATAWHVADLMMEAPDALVYAGLTRPHPAIRRYHELAMKWAKAPDADVAALVLRSEARDGLSGAAWLPACHVGIGSMGVPETVVQVGSPLEVRHQARTGTLLPKVDSKSGQVAVMLTTCLKSCDAANHANDEAIEARAKRWPSANDYHVDWSERDAEGGARVEMPHPGGMSGGGVWDWRCPTDEVWTPDRLRLIGINWLYTPGAKCVRAVPAEVWLKVAHDACWPG
jgi:hypothetical protein